MQQQEEAAAEENIVNKRIIGRLTKHFTSNEKKKAYKLS